ncbi:U3 small nucleolar RNA-associated protein 11 [Cymbomonas tetramitiformis]|uniref:U3 small nucleolar RNA-associated protein 11 n=1 Tax=Cymbomonas tetramitiformis TaxID=36881 RepID=A0AAE0FUE3_9CHLO|nr:U3 small nucleolar RNA-associated protein 11 [Cymbomonas tetramitiformis]
MSSAFKNAVKRKTHKERSQPSHRRKHGLLEKHKDYVLRARDYHEKEKRVKNLKEKAENRNPDEFYFAMEKQKTVDGIHQARQEEDSKHSQQELLLMKTQDMKYVQNKGVSDKKRAERLKESLHLIGDEPTNKHIVFVNDRQEAKSFDAAEHFDTAPELLSRTFNRPRRGQPQEKAAAMHAALGARGLTKTLERQRSKSYKEMADRAERAEKMISISQGMALQKDLMGKGRKRKMKASDGATVYRWKRERKK